MAKSRPKQLYQSEQSQPELKDTGGLQITGKQILKKLGTQDMRKQK